MNEINLKPYVALEKQSFIQKSVFNISKENFIDFELDKNKIIFSFFDCNFKDLEITNDEDIEIENITIYFHSCFIEKIKISNIFDKNVSILFGSSIISGNVENDNLKSLSLNNCILNDTLFIKNLNKVNINFTENNIRVGMWKELFQRLEIDNFDKFIKKSQSYYIENVKEIDFYCQERTNIPTNLKRGFYYKDQFNKTIYFLSQKEKNEFNISLSIRYNNDFEDTYTKIDNVYLYNFSLFGNSSGKISVDNSKIHRIYIHKFSTSNELSFYNLSPLKSILSLTKFEIHKSNLENSWFDNIDFIKYSIVSFYRTKLNKTTFTSCNFPNDSPSFESFMSLENIHYPNIKSDNYYKDQYETFLQLKTALEGTGNVYEAQKLQAISYSSLRKIKELTKSDKVILFLNEISNNHNLSITKPFLWFFRLSPVVYILYLLSLNRIFNKNEIDFNLIGYYFGFIDITHRIDFLVKKSELNGFSIFLDFLSKLVFGYLIYQFISSFRKYGKK